MSKPSPALAFYVPLDNKGIELVGRFIIAWNQAEHLVDLTVADLLDLKMSAIDKIMGTPNVPARADIFLAVFSDMVKSAELVACADACATRLRALSNFRNDVAHGRWITWPVEEAAARKNLVTAPEITLADIKAKLDAVCRLTNRLADLRWRLAAHFGSVLSRGPSPWHDKF